MSDHSNSGIDGLFVHVLNLNCERRNNKVKTSGNRTYREECSCGSRLIDEIHVFTWLHHPLNESISATSSRCVAHRSWGKKSCRNEDFVQQSRTQSRIPNNTA